MAIEWSSSGLDLHLEWAGGRGLAEVIRDAVRDGRLVAGTRMPSTRGRPDLSLFPRAAWLAATRRALAGATAADFDYGDPREHAFGPALRVLAEVLRD